MFCKFLYKRGEYALKSILLIIVMWFLVFIFPDLIKSGKSKSYQVSERSSKNGWIQYCIDDSCWWAPYDYDEIKKFK